MSSSRFTARSTRWLAAVAATAALLGACGSDDKPGAPAVTTPESVIDASQGAGPDGANTGQDSGQSGDTVQLASTTSTATADTQEKIGIDSPGGGDSNGLPSGSNP